MLTSQGLMRIKTRALRSKVWFRLLSRTERAILDLTIKCVDRVRSSVLAKAISEIISRLVRTLRENFMERAEKFGRMMAEGLSKVAQKWGNKNARAWKHERSYVIFLGVNAANT